MGFIFSWNLRTEHLILWLCPQANNAFSKVASCHSFMYPIVKTTLLQITKHNTTNNLLRMIDGDESLLVFCLGSWIRSCHCHGSILVYFCLHGSRATPTFLIKRCFSKDHGGTYLECTVRTARAVNVEHAGAESAGNTGAATAKFWQCQKEGGGQFRTFLL